MSPYKYCHGTCDFWSKDDIFISMFVCLVSAAVWGNLEMLSGFDPSSVLNFLLPCHADGLSRHRYHLQRVSPITIMARNNSLSCYSWGLSWWNCHKYVLIRTRSKPMYFLMVSRKGLHYLPYPFKLLFGVDKDVIKILLVLHVQKILRLNIWSINQSAFRKLDCSLTMMALRL